MISSKSLNTDYGMVRGYTMVVMVYEGEELRDSITVTNRTPSTTLIAEFTPKRVEEIGKALRFRVFDATSYVTGMDTLSLLININNETPGKRLFFSTSLSNVTRVGEFTVPFYKSVVIEFDLQSMRNRMRV